MKKKTKKQPEHKSAFEDWHKPEYEDDPDNAPTKFMKPPKRYEEDFMKKMDKRSEVYKQLSQSFSAVVEDMGGEENLSHVQLCLAERFCFLEFVLRRLEVRIASNPEKSQVKLSRWIQALNSLNGLGKTVGLIRQKRKTINLKSYVLGKPE